MFLCRCNGISYSSCTNQHKRLHKGEGSGTQPLGLCGTSGWGLIQLRAMFNTMSCCFS